MQSRFVHVVYVPEGHFWEATSLADGAVYRARGRSPAVTFQQVCQMHHLPTDRWRITLVAPDAIQCEHLPAEQFDVEPVGFVGR